jgi:predicted ATPase/DNA-binding SARP family transcriptional activator
MPRLCLRLLGPPRIRCNGEPIVLDRHKAVALLAYLAVTGEAHRRDSLVNLLWPEYDGTRGRAALRRTLYALRRALDGEWLLVDREEIGLKAGPDLWMDVAQFRHHLSGCETHGHPANEVCPTCVEPLANAVALVRGEFLSGFSLKDSINFDDWQLMQTERLRRELAYALQKLVDWHGSQRAFEVALGYARRRLALDALDEEAHCQLMRLYVWSGHRSSALRQYDECSTILKEQLGVPPQVETTALYQSLLEGHVPLGPGDRWGQEGHVSPVSSEERGAIFPPFLEQEVPVERPIFVARERELAQLARYLDVAVAGKGQVVLVSGDAGSGKTALVQEFSLRAQTAHPDLVIASGHGNAHTGVGDPYLPFREILGLLTGDVEAQLAAGAMSREQARRLWLLLPLALRALTETGPDLVGLFVPATPLLERAAAVRPWPLEPGLLDQLRNLAADRATVASKPSLQQSALFEQYTQVLRVLSAERPLLLALDDLQWADAGSLNLLFHLGRRMAGSRILIIGAYRPAEVALGRPAYPLLGGPFVGRLEKTRELDGLAAGRHPLESIVYEFKRTFGDIEVDLEPGEGRTFVDALLDSEPNLLTDAFREALYQHTRGHPLFTVELLRGMQDRGDLLRNEDGLWVEGPSLDWETLPARVEAVVAERIRRLPRPLRSALRVASVEGEEFTAEVVANIRAIDEHEILDWLSAELDRRHRLVRAQSIRRMEGRVLSRYRFRHILFQKYLYSGLDSVERVHLHERVGIALEDLYGTQGGPAIGAIAPQLARHFEEAGIAEKAIHYLHQAGLMAVQLFAYQEAVSYLNRGLFLLRRLPVSAARDEQELALQLALGRAWLASSSPGPEVGDAYARARELCQQMEATSQLCQVLGELSIFHYVRAEHERARELGEQVLSLAQGAGDPLLVARGHWYLGFTSFCLGQYTAARAHLEQVIDLYSSEQQPDLVLFLRGPDAGLSALAYVACCLWCLGYPDQALKRSQEAFALARKLDQPFSLAEVLSYGGCMFSRLLRDAQALRDNAEELIRLSNERGMTGWSAGGIGFLGEALAMQGQVHEGIARMREGMGRRLAAGIQCNLPGTLCSLAGAQAEVGWPEEGLSTLAEALAQVEETEERHWEAEIHRLGAELLLTQGQEVEAEESLLRAVEVARSQSARSWELRATTSLARLWQKQGKVDQAREALAEVSGWFTEGFDTLDLREAQALLTELS